VTLPHKSLRTEAFINQAKLDVDLAVALYSLVKDKADLGLLGSRPQLYCPAIYAYCQQAIEKALKAWLCHSQGKIPMDHNPLKLVLESSDMKKPGRPTHLDMIDRKRRYLDSILDMAPGAGMPRNATREKRLSKPNTEYPYAEGDRVVLPSSGIGFPDVNAALHESWPLVEAIRKYIEAQNLSPR